MVVLDLNLTKGARSYSVRRAGPVPSSAIRSASEFRCRLNGNQHLQCPIPQVRPFVSVGRVKLISWKPNPRASCRHAFQIAQATTNCKLSKIENEEMKLWFGQPVRPSARGQMPEIASRSRINLQRKAWRLAALCSLLSALCGECECGM
jgi:hypothetical protein